MMDAPAKGLILRPPQRHTDKELMRALRQEPLIFLGGPIQGAPDWQEEAIAWLQKHRPEIHVANPRSLMWEKNLNEAEETELFRVQRVWERDYLNYALNFGVPLFWGAAEVEHHPERAYAQTTRFELGVMVASAFTRRRACFGRHGMPRIAVGLAHGFSNRRYLSQTITEEFGVPVHDTLAATLEAAEDIVDDWMK